MTKREIADVADRMIGAVQILERAARQLKADARNVRGGCLHETMTAELWILHKTADVKTAAASALIELGGLPAGSWLTEHRAEDQS